MQNKLQDDDIADSKEAINYSILKGFAYVVGGIALVFGIFSFIKWIVRLF